MNVVETIKDIRRHCRMAMNGAASTSMREHGLTYKLNFGVSLMQIKNIASQYSASKKLAESLWKEDVRELKILATLLYPPSQFEETTADTWITEIPNQEIREQVCLNLFQKLSYAKQLSEKWINSDSEKTKVTGYWLLARLLISSNNIGANSINYSSVLVDVLSEDIFLRNAALLVLKNIGKKSEDEANNILNLINSLKSSDNILEKEVYESLSFEFEYHYNK